MQNETEELYAMKVSSAAAVTSLGHLLSLHFHTTKLFVLYAYAHSLSLRYALAKQSFYFSVVKDMIIVCIKYHEYCVLNIMTTVILKYSRVLPIFD